MRSTAHLSGNADDVVAEQWGQRPGARQVDVEAVTLVLGEHDDASVPTVHQVRQHEIDQAVVPAERHCRFGAITGEGGKPFALAAGKHHRENVGFRVMRDHRALVPLCEV